MSILQYIKNSLWDMLLCICASSALTFVMCTGFDSTRPFQEAPWIIIGLSVLFAIVLFCISYTPFTAAIGGVVLAIAIAGATIGCWQSSGTTSILDDVVGNNATFVLLISLCSVLVFLLSRRKPTLLVLAGGGMLMCAAIEYLYFLNHIVATLLFGVFVVAMYAYRNYQQNLLGSESEKISFGTATVAGLVIAALTLSLGAGVFCLCIAPLNPPHLVIKLLTKNMRLDEEEVRGIGDNVSVINENLFSMNVGDIVVNANGTGDLNQQQNMDNTQINPNSTLETPNAGSALNIDERIDKDAGEATSFNIPRWAWIATPIALLLLIAAIIGGRKFLRRRKLESMMSLPAGQRVRALFMYFIGCFGKMKMPQPGTNTLQEYLRGAKGTLCGFEQTSGEPSFNEIASAYSAWAYGSVEPTDDQLDACKSYYDSFHKNARKQVGILKYIPLFFRI